MLNNISKYLDNIKKNKIYITCVGILFFLFPFISTANTDTVWSWISDLLVSFVDLIWTIWFIFPIIAGKLLTNDFVYWTIFNMDTMLWHIWNFSRTLANFVIWFLFIYLILKHILQFSDKDASLLKSWLPKIVISSILINMSWFILWVLIDISTILIASFWSMPGNLVWEDTTKLVFPKNIEISVQKCNAKDNVACLKWVHNIDINKKNSVSLKDLQKYETNISWPLLFMWASILEVTNINSSLFNEAYDNQAKKFKSDGAAMKAMVKIFIFIMFIIPIIILIVVNVLRVFWLWIYISFSPLLFLDWIWWKNKLQNKNFAFKNVIWLIFSPAIVVLGFSLSTILVLWVADALNTTEWNNKYENEVKSTFLMDDWGNWIVEVSYWTQQDTWSMSKYIWWFFWYLITSILLIIVVWIMLKLSFKATEVTSWVSEKLFNFSEDLFKSVPIPTPLWWISVWWAKMLWQNIMATPDNLTSKQTEHLVNYFWKIDDLKTSTLNSILSWFHNSLSLVNSLDDAFSELEKYKARREAETSKNIQTLVDTMEKAMNKNIKLKKYWTDFSRASTYREKIGIILKNMNDIKHHIRSTDFS